MTCSSFLEKKEEVTEKDAEEDSNDLLTVEEDEKLEVRKLDVCGFA